MNKRHLAALALLLSACGSETSVPTIAPISALAPSASPLADQHERLDAIGTLLTACAARLRGEPVDPADNCAKVMPDVAEVIGEAEKKADRLPPSTRSAVTEVRRQLGEIAPCEPWFAAGGQSADARLNQQCGDAWRALYKSYSAVRNTA
ncbi:hypothetical protein [Nocardia sp. NRRL S-836]|uniref:hypothetical protein n=1 Tax=Nocardia sp. NRRL S-836 TaxID=1519492 RepID=UPI0006AE71E6|nr:hypothetical protein [Nocardia sp. NRRL S-836]KOV83817.1 hypothetical protein ADL03_19115 [Nocardia sp. NRRL S-836]